MPPKVKITKDEIIRTAVELIRQEGESGREALEREGEEKQQGKHFLFFLHIKSIAAASPTFLGRLHSRKMKEEAR